VVTGGSGLYVRAALDRLEIPPTDQEVRRRLEAEAAERGTPAMFERLRQVDPAAAVAIERGNTRRIVRALEVIELTGRPFSATMPRREYLRPTVTLGLAVPRPVLDERIEQRVQRMWRDGLLDEVRGLEPLGLREGRTASRAIGYAQALAQLDGDLTKTEAQQQTAALTRRLARRQESWFRPDPRVTWLDPRDDDAVARAVHLVQRAISDNVRHG
jgi:tRNA dimethylallyltransferase